MPGTTMNSRFAGTCSACTEGIDKDAKIEYYGKGEVYHFDCRPVADRKPEWREFKQEGFLFIDLETGGLNEEPGVNAQGHLGPCGIVQIAVIATSSNFVVQDMLKTYVQFDPDLIYTEEAEKVHGMTAELLVDQPAELDALSNLVEFCQGFDGYRFSGYNTAYDLKFIKAALKRRGIVDKFFIEPALCLYEVSKELVADEIKNKPGASAEERRCKLVNVANHLGIKNENAHDALVDLYMTVKVARQLVKWS